MEEEEPTYNEVDVEALTAEWQEKHDPDLVNLSGLQKFIQERVTKPVPEPKTD